MVPSMTWFKSMLVAILPTLAVTACGGPSTVSGNGELDIVIGTEGSPLDRDGYTVVVRRAEGALPVIEQAVGVEATVVLSEVEPGIVTIELLLCFSRAPIERLTAYKRRMGWEFPYVSTYNTEFAFDFGLAITQEQARQVPEVKEMIEKPPDWLQEWSGQVGAPLKDGLRETPGWIAFARENGTVYHTYTVTAPDPFVAPYFSFLLERTPKAQPAEPRSWRKDEYPE